MFMQIVVCKLKLIYFRQILIEDVQSDKTESILQRSELGLFGYLERKHELRLLLRDIKIVFGVHGGHLGFAETLSRQLVPELSRTGKDRAIHSPRTGCK